MNIYLRFTISISVLVLLAFFGCKNSNNKLSKKLSSEEFSSYESTGSKLATSTQKVLASNLVVAIEENGVSEAIEFCNIQAIPLTDSMSVELEAHIKRVTDQPRNPNNLANESEMEYIQSAKTTLQNGQDVTPSVRQTNGTVTGYYPIITNQLCMQCHGNEGSQINDETLTKIKELYPNDKATGYEVGQLRGIWVVEMKKDSLQ
ncbi:DUF3365 domain-containing protein [Gracilimonas sp.]|uniref:Tll0287-like domain-containing protein n=1 Tax=Gracilimonas sp. TaxID=1974203 RepID=UPI0028723752|nr:DUF3365 domain-containing protein [Gracilimonas sp.]